MKLFAVRDRTLRSHSIVGRNLVVQHIFGQRFHSCRFSITGCLRRVRTAHITSLAAANTSFVTPSMSESVVR
jgi:hypothetical protein